MNILCTDKTGTLTEGELVLSQVLDAEGQASDEVRHLAFLNAALETGIENPLDAAIIAAGESAGLTKHGFTKIDEIPYDRSEEHTSELQSLMRISYAVFCLNKKTHK